MFYVTHLLLIVPLAGKSKTKVPAASLSAEGSLPGSASSLHLVSSHDGQQREEETLVSLKLRTPIPFLKAPPS